MRKADLEIIRKTESLVLGQQLMKVRCSAAPMSEHKDRRLNRDVFQQRIEAAFPSRPDACLNALERDCQRSRQTHQVQGER